MKDIVILAVISVLIGMMIPKSTNDGMKKAISFTAGIALMLTICRPIAEASENLAALPERFLNLLIPHEEMEEEAEEARQWVIQYSTENIENGVSALVENRYALPDGSVRTEAVTETDEAGNLLLARLVLYTDDAVQCSPAEIASFVSSVLACPCEVIGDTE